MPGSNRQAEGIGRSPHFPINTPEPGIRAPNPRPLGEQALHATQLFQQLGTALLDTYGLLR